MLTVGQIIEENVRIDSIACSVAVFAEYSFIDTMYGAKAVVGIPTAKVQINREQLLNCEEAESLRRCIHDPFDLHDMEENLAQRRFEDWLSENGQTYTNVEENKPHTLLRLMRLEERNRAQSIGIDFMAEGLLFNKLSVNDAHSLTQNALEYCVKYGMPLGKMIESKDGFLYKGCTMDDLYFLIPNGLNHLYNSYMAWRYLQLDDIEAKDKCLMLGGNAPTCERDYKRIVVGWQPTSIGVQPIYNEGIPQLLSICDSQLDMAATQLTYIIALGSDYLNGKGILYCKGCKEPFLSTHGSRKYCDKCRSSSTVRVRAMRRNGKHTEKEASSNASKDETRER